jgi:prevent-host-death family protein
MVMEEVSISEFKAKCLAIIERVRKTRKPVRITRFGKPVAELVAPSPTKDRADWIGSMADEGEILGDIISPIIDLDEIEALKD